jgi:hypothetical protein
VKEKRRFIFIDIYGDEGYLMLRDRDGRVDGFGGNR